jgi:pyruvate kinase
VTQPIRTKIVATLGPATATPAVIAALLDSGVCVVRLNFSHGEPGDHARALRAVRAAADERGKPVAVLGDLCGPKIRLNAVTGERVELPTGGAVRVERGGAPCTPQVLTVTYDRLLDEVRVGQRIYIDDGSVRLLVTDRMDDALLCNVTAGGAVSGRKGVNLPDTRLSVAALTDKDRRDLQWAIEQGLDYVALSFVRRPDDVRELREIIRGSASRIGVVVKIEKVEALEHLDELVAAADAVMVARGDLGVEMDPWHVPLVQKAITGRCREVGKPVIIATQMLQSMVASAMPTRAEVSDVANAILDGVDAVMLSAETAVGAYPIQAVDVMSQVARATEAFLSQRGRATPAASVVVADRLTSAIAEGAVQAALHLNARAVAVWTVSGETARLVAQRRLPMPVIAITHDECVCRRLNLLFGVTPSRVKPVATLPEMLTEIDRCLSRCALAAPGDLVVVAASTQPTVPGATDTTLIHRVARA